MSSIKQREYLVYLILVVRPVLYDHTDFIREYNKIEKELTLYLMIETKSQLCNLQLWGSWNIADFVTKDYSHIVHVYFVGVFCCSHPYRNGIDKSCF